MVPARSGSAKGLSGWGCYAIVAWARASLEIGIQLLTETLMNNIIASAGMQAALWRLGASANRYDGVRDPIRTA